jgi:hypothetical protein
LKEQGDGEEKKDYMQDAGTAMSRIFGGIKAALGDIKNTPYIGPKAQNGGEVIIAAGMCHHPPCRSMLIIAKTEDASICTACRILLTTRTLRTLFKLLEQRLLPTQAVTAECRRISRSF